MSITRRHDRNSIVTRIFRVVKLSENAGSGFNKMFNGWKAYYEDEPVVSGGIDFYKITFPLVKIGEEVVRKGGQKRWSEKLSEKETIILKLIKEEPKISKQEISIKGELTKKSVEYNITLLKRKGLLRRIGADRGGYWEVAEG